MIGGWMAAQNPEKRRRLYENALTTHAMQSPTTFTAVELSWSSDAPGCILKL
jgi:hypothetical protein